MVKIAFWKSNLSTDSETQVIYDYAYYNESILGNESIILYNKHDVDNNQEIIQKFCDKFSPNKIHYVNHWLEVDPFLVKHNVDIIYMVKSGYRDNYISFYKKTVVHCTDHIYQCHGDIYLPISDKVHGVSELKNAIIVPHPLYMNTTDQEMMQLFKTNFIDPCILLSE